MRLRFFWVLLITLVTRLPAFFVSLYSNDEATYSALAVRILAGALPYVGAVDHKPVGIELTYAAVYALVGPYRLLLVRLLLVLVVAATGWLVGELAVVLSRNPQARWAAVLYVAASACGLASDVQAANTELFLNLPLAAAALCMTRRRWIAAGALTALASFYKYQAALAGLAWFLVGGRQAAVGLATGFLVPWSAYLGFFALTHSFGGFVRWGLGYNFRYMSVLTVREIAGNAVSNTLLVAGFWAPLVVCAWRGRSRFGRVWLVVMALAIAPGGRFFPHYYLMALPALAVLGAEAAVAHWRKVLACGLPIVAGAVVVACSWYDLRPGLRQQSTVLREVGAWLHEHSTPADRIFVWGGSSPIYYYARRVMATRFAFTNYHTGKIWGSPLLDDIDARGTERWISPEAWTELMADLSSAPPLYIVDAAAGRLGLFDRHPIARYPRLARFVDERYQLAENVDGVPVYRLRSATGGQ